MQATSLKMCGLFAAQPNVTATIVRSPTFPAPRTSGEKHWVPKLVGWGSLPMELDGGDIQLELLDLVSERASSVVYSARVLLGPSHELNLLTEICVKIARPTRYRSLPRDAWFYEQLDREEGYSGVVVPRCFGFFSLPVKDIWPASQDTAPSNMLRSIRSWSQTMEDDEDDRHLRSIDRPASRIHLL